MKDHIKMLFTEIGDKPIFNGVSETIGIPNYPPDPRILPVFLNI